MKLYPYQQEQLKGLAKAWTDGHRNICLQGPTGSGKTVVAGEIIRRLSAHNKRVVVLVHREELATQFCRTLVEVGLGFKIGMIKSGQTIMSALPIQIASVQTLVRRTNRIDPPDIIITDEAHHAAANTYQKIYAKWPNARRLGLTATPARLDDKPLLGIFETLVLGPQTKDLIEQGYLSSYTLLRPKAKVKIDGDLIVDIPQLIHRYVDGRKTILFAASRDEGKWIERRCLDTGLNAAYIDGETNKNIRRQILGRLDKGNLQVLVNVDLISEGFDCPSVEAIILNRPTDSITVHLQQVGRVLRKSERDAVIIDVYGNTARLGEPDDVYIWSLQEGVKCERKEKEKEQKKKEVEERKAQEHYTEVQIKMVEVASKQITIRPGTTGMYARDDVNRAVRKCQTFEDILGLAKELGYSAGWARKRWQLKTGRIGHASH